MSTVPMPRLLALAVLSLGALLAFAGCASAPSTLSNQDSIRTLTTAANTHWVLAKWTSADGGKVAILQPAPTLSIGYQGRISGQAGVNDYVANVSVANDTLDWGDHIGLTRMAGTPELMESEARYLRDLKACLRLTVRGNRLLFTGEKPLRLEFTRADP